MLPIHVRDCACMCISAEVRDQLLVLFQGKQLPYFLEITALTRLWDSLSRLSWLAGRHL